MKHFIPLGLLALLCACDPLTPPAADNDADNDGVLTDVDCDDADASVGLPQTQYLDHDLDGFGDEAFDYTGCDVPMGYVDNAEDCDDGDGAINPDGVELCDTVDNDCDGTTDVDAIDAATWYEDLDGDGQGSEVVETACEPFEGFVSTTGDCVDSDPRVFTGATEFCDHVDNDCDGQVDEADDNPDAMVLWDDDDGDGFGDNAGGSFWACPADGFVEQGGDCVDSDADISPDSIELCDEIDNDCNGYVDEDAADASVWYDDMDGDSFGNPTASSVSCTAPVSSVADNTDCDDAVADVKPSATELCDGIDNDCDGAVDPSTSTDAVTWYSDQDSDSFGNDSVSLVSCVAPVGYVGNNTDCNDTSDNIFPGATEVCDNADNDCDGNVDESAVDMSTWYADMDNDSYGEAGDSIVACSVSSGYVANNTDCNDTDASVNPGASEVCDSADNDCDGTVDEGVQNTYYADQDGDGYGDLASITYACSLPSGYSVNSSDCDDNNASSFPGGTEVCDGADNDCNGDIDPNSSTGAPTWYADGDGDGYGDVTSPSISCSPPAGSVSDLSDCDDDNELVSPGEDENTFAACTDEIDNDCDTAVDENDSECFTDEDLDGQTPMFGDCDDEDATIYDGAPESCGDEIDQDCDGLDTECPPEATFCCLDDDGDGYGDPEECQFEESGFCEVDYVEGDGDCDDQNASVYPDAYDSPFDGEDADCDGLD